MIDNNDDDDDADDDDGVDKGGMGEVNQVCMSGLAERLPIKLLVTFIVSKSTLVFVLTTGIRCLVAACLSLQNQTQTFPLEDFYVDRKRIQS